MAEKDLNSQSVMEHTKLPIVAEMDLDYQSVIERAKSHIWQKWT